MQLGHLTVVAVEERDEVLGQIPFIFFIQRPHNPAVDTDILRILRVLVAHEDIARVHVRMEKAVAEHLGEEHLYATLS